MAKFNVVQKRRRAAIAEQKRQIHGDTVSRKLHQKQQTHSISGKRKQKLLRKWRREQKEALDKGLITMQDVEMAEADEVQKFPVKFSMKKSAKLKLRFKQMKKKDTKKKTSQKPTGEASAEVMVE